MLRRFGGAVAARRAASSAPSLTSLLPPAVAARLRDAPPEPEMVFCNRALRMDRVKAIGFDYDYTLASYTSDLNELIYDKAKEHLTERSNYPPIETSYDKTFAVRGLLFDRRHGFLVKLTYARAVSGDAAFLGRRRLGEDELRRAYGEALHLDPDYVTAHCSRFNDIFSLSEACLLADVVQLAGRRRLGRDYADADITQAVDRGIAFDATALAEDVAQAVTWVHINGELHDAVKAAPARFIHPILGFADSLAAARRSGKKLFILTNSPLSALDTGMRYLLGDDWRDAFDLVVASSRKPTFFSRDQPFRAVHAEGFTKWARAEFRDVEKRRPLLGGSLAELTRITGWEGREVLYVGDHVHADLREPRRRGWATCAIVRELETEIAVAATEEYEHLHERSSEADDLLKRCQALGAGSETLDALEAEREALRVRQRRLFNESFGSVFRHRADATAYAAASHHLGEARSVLADSCGVGLPASPSLDCGRRPRWTAGVALVGLRASPPFQRWKSEDRRT